MKKNILSIIIDYIKAFILSWFEQSEQKKKAELDFVKQVEENTSKINDLKDYKEEQEISFEELPDDEKIKRLKDGFK